MSEHERYRSPASLKRELSPGVLADLLLPRDGGEKASLNFEIKAQRRGENYCLGFKYVGQGKRWKKSEDWEFDHANVFTGEENVNEKPETITRGQVVNYLSSLGFDGEGALKELLKEALKKSSWLK